MWSVKVELLGKPPVGLACPISGDHDIGRYAHSRSTGPVMARQHAAV
jgi:hypothetical protein